MASPYATAGTIVSRAAVQLGLAAPPSNDPYAAAGSDPNFGQLNEFLTLCGNDLLRAHTWPELRNTTTITTVNGQTVYPLPADFREMIDQTGWNRTTRLPMIGPMSEQQWQFLVALQVGITLNALFRMTPQEIEFFPAPSAGQVIAFTYLSFYWVQDAANSAVVDSAGQPIGDKTKPTQAGDLILFDETLMVRALKVQFLQAKGFDASIALKEYQDHLQHLIGQAQGAPKLNMSRQGFGIGGRLLDLANIPITNFGT